MKTRKNLLKLPSDLSNRKQGLVLFKKGSRPLFVVLSKFQIYTSNDLSFFICICGWCLPDSHKLYGKYNKSFKYITLSRSTSGISVMKLCPGINAPDINNSLVIQRHIVPHDFRFSVHKLSNKSNQLEYSRSNNCALLSEEEQPFSECQKLKVKVKSEVDVSIKAKGPY